MCEAAEASSTDEDRWIFDEARLQNIPSLRDGVTAERELKHRQQGAAFMQEMSEKLNHNVKDPRARISQLCMCAAMIHMHRFLVFHSVRSVEPRDLAAAALFLAGKSEECPRKLEHIVKVWHMLKYPKDPPIDPKSDKYLDAVQLLVTLENVLLQTIAFDLQVEIPHTHVLNAVQRQRIVVQGNRKNLTETAYYFATDMYVAAGGSRAPRPPFSLHLTNYCVRFRASTIAAVCLNLACVWADYQIPDSPDGKPWYYFVDSRLTWDELHKLTTDFGRIYEYEKDRLNVRRQWFEKRAQQQSRGEAAVLPNVPAAALQSSSSAAAGEASTSAPPPLHQPATVPPPPSSPMKRVKTEPAVLDLLEYKAKYKARRVGNEQQPAAASAAVAAVTGAAPTAARKSFMPDISSSQKPLVVTKLEPKSEEGVVADAHQRRREGHRREERSHARVKKEAPDVLADSKHRSSRPAAAGHSLGPTAQQMAHRTGLPKHSHSPTATLPTDLAQRTEKRAAQLTEQANGGEPAEKKRRVEAATATAHRADRSTAAVDKERSRKHHRRRDGAERARPSVPTDSFLPPPPQPTLAKQTDALGLPQSHSDADMTKSILKDLSSESASAQRAKSKRRTARTPNGSLSLPSIGDELEDGEIEDAPSNPPSPGALHTALSTAPTTYT